jgi:hypothetical protein
MSQSQTAFEEFINAPIVFEAPLPSTNKSMLAPSALPSVIFQASQYAAFDP